MPVYMQQHFGGPRLVLASRTPPQPNNDKAKIEGKVQSAASKPLPTQGVGSTKPASLPKGKVRKENQDPGASTAVSVACGNSPRKVHRAAGFGLVPSIQHHK